MNGFETATASARADQVAADVHDAWQTGADALPVTPAIASKLAG